ncbi:YceI family protein [Lysobacter antibioticus]|uniref:YceI family protein n=1 Tax=Lysobacter antibioticus TaxID=84531 RepID=UPI00146FF6D8|nr:YceI family protein [Lysobacter antibioticus]
MAVSQVRPAPSRWRRLRSRVVAGAAFAAAFAWPAWAQPTFQVFDPDHTRFSFELRTRWGQKVAGVFPRYDGEVSTLADGRHQVRIRLATAAVQLGDSERYTRLARGERFFNAPLYPYIEFLSEPHAPDLVRTGGALRGKLTLHGVSRMETFVLSAPACARPGEDCDAIAQGSVSRYDYRLDGWQLALGDRVRFTMQVRLKPGVFKHHEAKPAESRSNEGRSNESRPADGRVPERKESLR